MTVFSSGISMYAFGPLFQFLRGWIFSSSVAVGGHCGTAFLMPQARAPLAPLNVNLYSGRMMLTSGGGTCGAGTLDLARFAIARRTKWWGCLVE